MGDDNALMFWSGGKDSAMALLQAQSRLKIDTLVTTVSNDYRRVSMHGVHENLLERQVASLDLRLEKIYLDQYCSNADYQSALESVLWKYRRQGVRKTVFGDIFLEDIRRWRERSLTDLDMEAVFPLWGRDTCDLAYEFIDLGFEAVVCCAGDAWLSEKSVGVRFDRDFVRALPQEVDPCGENGEFHSFVVNGPMFKVPVAVTLGEKVYRGIRTVGTGSDCGQKVLGPSRKSAGFWYSDLLEA